MEVSEALKDKWLWGFLKKGVLWRKVMVAKFGIDERGWFTRVGLRPHGKGVWRKAGIDRDEFQAFIR